MGSKYRVLTLTLRAVGVALLIVYVPLSLIGALFGGALAAGIANTLGLSQTSAFVAYFPVGFSVVVLGGGVSIGVLYIAAAAALRVLVEIRDKK